MGRMLFHSKLFNATFTYPRVLICFEILSLLYLIRVWANDWKTWYLHKVMTLEFINCKRLWQEVLSISSGNAFMIIKIKTTHKIMLAHGCVKLYDKTQIWSTKNDMKMWWFQPHIFRLLLCLSTWRFWDSIKLIMFCGFNKMYELKI